MNTNWYGEEYIKWLDSGCPKNEQVISLDVSYFNLKSLTKIKNLFNLKNFHCQHNSLISLEEIENLDNLISLNCSSNNLVSLKGIENLVNLINLNCSSNNLTSLNEIAELEFLKII